MVQAIFNLGEVQHGHIKIFVLLKANRASCSAEGTTKEIIEQLFKVLLNTMPLFSLKKAEDPVSCPG